ncbi:Lysosomal alpha-mannosidase [Blattella germanica]|nr:Lysosomal alpha-mannosidase [Blattella germanica]
MRWLELVVVVLFSCLLAEGTPVFPSTETPPDPTTSEIPPVSAAPKAKHQNGPPVCGYESCPKPLPGKLNVHLVPHTHDDVGWLKTVDQYFYGSKSNIQKAGVQYILDGVVRELSHDPNKRFIYVETAFFWKWWIRQNDWSRHQVKKLVQNGQLEFIGGAWSMNDEAATNYQSIIDQFTWGLRKLNDTFGECGHPKVGWQIDPFGHSREMASIFAQLGFDGLLFGRLDFQDKLNRLLTITAEMVWEGSPNNLGKSADLFTSVLYNNYAPPPGFCYDVLCDDEPFIDSKKSPDYNVPRLVKEFLNYVDVQSRFYTTDNIILTMGGDFTYQDAHMYYKNLDLLIRYVNEEQKNKSRVNVFYSTPSCYLKAVHDAGNSYTTKKDDFFPYASDEHSYWTGYFTSRPTLKRFERLGNNFLQVCKQLYSLTDLGPEDWVDLNMMREAMGVMQHHDAVTGTEKQHVAFDYARILYKGFEECRIITETALNKLIAPPKTPLQVPGANQIPIRSCLLLNISQCDVSETSSQFVVTVYNPLSRPVSKYIRFPVNGPAYSVKDPAGKPVKSQMVPIPQSVVEMPGRVSKAANELVFYAENLPPMGFRSYYISKGNKMHISKHYRSTDGRDIAMGPARFRILLDGHSGKLKSMRIDGVKFDVGQDLYYYEGDNGSNSEAADRASGAYIFRPNGTDAKRIYHQYKPITYKGDVRFRNFIFVYIEAYLLIPGDLVDEVHIKLNNWASQVWRYYKQGAVYSVELEWLVGPIPIEDQVGKEIITRFSSPLNSEGLFYTDSNGREMIERKRNFRPTWKLDLHEPVAGNYYPVTSKISIKDQSEKIEFAILTDRAQGGSSLNDGEIELMVHRRLLHDDNFGVGEALNETAYNTGLVAIGKHILTGGRIGINGTVAQAEHELAQELMLSPWIFFTPADNITFAQWTAKHKMEFSGLTTKLPRNVQILTLEPWKERTFLLRLEHIYERNEDAVLSKPVQVKLSNLFVPFSIVSARETTLGANQWLNETQRLKWTTESNEIDSDFTSEEKENHFSSSAEEADPLTITLSPMQIRTFVIQVKDSHVAHDLFEGDGDLLMED